MSDKDPDGHLLKSVPSPFGPSQPAAPAAAPANAGVAPAPASASEPPKAPAAPAAEPTVRPPPPPRPPAPGAPLHVRLHEVPLERYPLLGRLARSTLLVGLGIGLGLYFAPDSPRELRAQLASTQAQVQEGRARYEALQQTLRDTSSELQKGKLAPADRTRHERAGRRYVAALRRAQAQSAADLMTWFVDRWDQLLDFPQTDDRTGRRAATLALLVGGMAESLNEGDFIPWQAEFLGADWLGELHFDMDGNGLPGKRTAPNTHDGFANVSVCQVAMALNQSMTDGRVLMMPNMRCDRPEARMSVFLQGRTFDDALNEFVRAVKEQGFLALERHEKGVRLVLVGARRTPRREE